MTDHQIRASDQDREDAALVLAEAYAVGRLARAELVQRAAAVYSARTWGQLRTLTADLPARPPCPSFRQPSSRPRRMAAGQPDMVRLRLIARLAWILAFATAAGLAGLLIPAGLWVAAVLIPTALLMPPAIGISAALRRLHRNTAGTSRNRGQRLPQPSGSPRGCRRSPGPPRGTASNRGCHAHHAARPATRARWRSPL